MGVRDQNMRHGFPAHGLQQRRRVSRIVGAGIDDRDLAAADDVTDRAGEGERARIVAENPPHAGANFLDHAGLKRKIAVERDVVVIGHGIFLFYRHSGMARKAPDLMLCNCDIGGISTIWNDTARDSGFAPLARPGMTMLDPYENA